MWIAQVSYVDSSNNAEDHVVRNVPVGLLIRRVTSCAIVDHCKLDHGVTLCALVDHYKLAHRVASCVIADRYKLA